MPQCDPSMRVNPCAGAVRSWLKYQSHSQTQKTTSDSSVVKYKTHEIVAGTFSLPISIGSSTCSLYVWVHTPIGNSVISIVSSPSRPISPLAVNLCASSLSICPLNPLYDGVCQHKQNKDKQQTSDKWDLQTDLQSLGHANINMSGWPRKWKTSNKPEG